VNRSRTSNKSFRRGRIIVISGPSGVGKTTISDRILAKRRDIWYSVSATSRPRRGGERNGREYCFLSDARFKDWIRRKRFIEWAVVHGHLYGTPKKFLEDRLRRGRHVLLDVDVQGGLNLKRIFPDGIFIFIKPPSYAELKKRLTKRNTETAEDLQNRLAAAWREIKHQKKYGFVVVNDDLERTVDRILGIIDHETSN